MDGDGPLPHNRRPSSSVVEDRQNCYPAHPWDPPWPMVKYVRQANEWAPHPAPLPPHTQLALSQLGAFHLSSSLIRDQEVSFRAKGDRVRPSQTLNTVIRKRARTQHMAGGAAKGVGVGGGGVLSCCLRWSFYHWSRRLAFETEGFFSLGMGGRW